MFEVHKVVKNRVVAEKRYLWLKEENCGLRELGLKKERVGVEKTEL